MCASMCEKKRSGVVGGGGGYALAQHSRLVLQALFLARGSYIIRVTLRGNQKGKHPPWFSSRSGSLFIFFFFFFLFFLSSLCLVITDEVGKPFERRIRQRDEMNGHHKTSGWMEGGLGDLEIILGMLTTRLMRLARRCL